MDFGLLDIDSWVLFEDCTFSQTFADAYIPTHQILCCEASYIQGFHLWVPDRIGFYCQGPIALFCGGLGAKPELETQHPQLALNLEWSVQEIDLGGKMPMGITGKRLAIAIGIAVRFRFTG